MVLIIFVFNFCLVDVNATDDVYRDDSSGSDQLIGTNANENQNTFLELALIAETASNAEKERFIRVALDEMLLFFGAELDTVRDTPLDDSARAKRTIRWEASASSYVDKLIDAAERLKTTENMNVLVQENGSVLLFISESLVMVSSPRLSEQVELERRIAERLCPTGGCVTLIDTPEFSFEPSVPRGRWQTNNRNQQTYVAGEGRACTFATLDHQALKQRLCRRLLQEILHLAGALQKLRKQKRDVNWQSLGITELRHSSLHRVMVSETQTLSLWLPMLGADSNALMNWRDVVKSIVTGEGDYPTLNVPEAYVSKFDLLRRSP